MWLDLGGRYEETPLITIVLDNIVDGNKNNFVLIVM